MAQGEFTKEEARKMIKALDEMNVALPETEQTDFFGNLSDIRLFLGAAEKAAPDEPKD